MRIGKRALRKVGYPLLAAALGAVLLVRCGALPPLGDRTVSMALADTGATRLGRAVSPLAGAHPGGSGIHPLRDARNAFAARFLLAQAAERTLDVQYYIWHKDLSGTLLLGALLAAADRGVRVRFLMDDNSTWGLDEALAALDAHPNVEVRLFNPLGIRRPRVLGYLADPWRVNRRMHNKSFTADNQATIVGGRNVGDEYFGATDGVLFADLDTLAVGPVVREVSSAFDRYWASGSSYPAGLLLPPAGAVQAAELASAVSRCERDPDAVAYMTALRSSPFVRELVEGTLALEWTAVRMISDDPAKALGRAGRETMLPHKMRTIFGEPEEGVDLVSPYFVPTADGTDMFVAWARRGVRVRVLTNALEATDAAPVHSGYARWRKALLEAGVELYELRRSPAAATAAGAAGRAGGLSGSSGSSLHAKTFAVDRSRVFLGSFNFDPRSAELNTEMGFVIESPELARKIAAAFDGDVPANAYEVRLSGSGDLVWIERRNGASIRHDTEPGASAWRRAGVWLLSKLPIEGLL
ncbi:MAG: phospholipase D family protein [Acidobacteriota bacterium]